MKQVYAIQRGGNGPIKIGFSQNLRQRLAMLQTSSPERLRVIATADGGADVETAIHQKLSQWRISGEWFSPQREVLALIHAEMDRSDKASFFWIPANVCVSVAESRKEIGGEAIAVFLLLIGTMDYDNNIMISQGEIGERLSMAKQSVSRAMKKLVELGCIEPARTVGKVKYYRLNPAYGWKGKAEDHRKALHANGIYAVK